MLPLVTETSIFCLHRTEGSPSIKLKRCNLQEILHLADEQLARHGESFQGRFDELGVNQEPTEAQWLEVALSVMASRGEFYNCWTDDLDGALKFWEMAQSLEITQEATMFLDEQGYKTAFVINHPERGVYLGNFMGLGIWSKLDSCYQPAAVTFQTIEEAEAVMATWDSGRPSGIELIKVIADDGEYASMKSCMASGIEEWEDKIPDTEDTFVP